MSEKVVLFDLPCRGRCACWSLNPWKSILRLVRLLKESEIADTTSSQARAALNFKGIPYRTEWIEYCDMAAKFKSLGISPTTTSSLSGWSIPAICAPDGSYTMDSRRIADVLEALKPEPSLQLDSGYVEGVQAAVSNITDSLSPILIPRVPDLLLNESSGTYFRETRAKSFGMPLEEFANSEGSGEIAWKNAESGIKELRTILREHPDGPFVLGEKPSYPDIILAGFCAFVASVDQGDIFDRFLGFNDALANHWQACQMFLERDDH